MGDRTEAPSIDPAIQQYMNALNEQYSILESSLPGQRAGQESIIRGTYDTSMANLAEQEAANRAMLDRQRETTESRQARTLRDLANAMTQSYNTFSGQLGALGAGHSSAAQTMLPYALSRAEAKQRGAITADAGEKLADIDAREAQLAGIVTQERRSLDNQRDTQLIQLSQWYDNAMNQIRASKAQDKSQMAAQLLNQAMVQMQNIQQQAAQRQSALEQWAMNNSQNLAQIRQNLSSISDPSLLGSFQGYTPINMLGSMSGARGPQFGGFATEEERRI